MSSDSLFCQPFGVAWRSALVQLPRYVPTQVLRFTSPDGPQPFVLSLPSRDKHLIPNYVFLPTDLTPDEASTLPIVLDFHGGGFVLGSPLEQAPFCSKLARELRCVVLSIDYRLGPISKYPAANEDAEDVLRAVLDVSFKGYVLLREAIESKIRSNYRKTDGSIEIPMRVRIDRQKVAVSGFSSGGNLALNLALSINNPEEKTNSPSVIPHCYPSQIPLLLYYPSLDARQLPSERTRPEGLGCAKGFWSEVTDKLVPTYLPRDKADEPRASPGLADLSGLHEKARMLLILPELDDLAEQSEMWVKKVQQGGRGDDLKVERFKGMKHGWTQMPEAWLNDAEKMTRASIFDETVTFINDIWNGKSAHEAGGNRLLSPVELEQPLRRSMDSPFGRTSMDSSRSSSQSSSTSSLSVPSVPRKHPSRRSLRSSVQPQIVVTFDEKI